MTFVKRIFISFCGLVMLAFTAGITSKSVFAADYGIYTATAKPYYTHPVTGIIEDSGQNPVIGQAMTESVLHKTALIEVDREGKVFVTFRFSLMDNIKNFVFQVQKDGHFPFRDVKATIMKEDLGNNKTDFRIEMPSENAIVRSTFYVIPMGREVVFYMNFSDLKAGSGDFITSITVVPDPTPSKSGSASPVASPTPGDPQTPKVTSSPEASVPGETSLRTVQRTGSTLPQAAAPGYVKADGLLVYQINTVTEKKPPLNPVAFLAGAGILAVVIAGTLLFGKMRRHVK